MRERVAAHLTDRAEPPAAARRLHAARAESNRRTSELPSPATTAIVEEDIPAWVADHVAEFLRDVDDATLKEAAGALFDAVADDAERREATARQQSRDQQERGFYVAALAVGGERPQVTYTGGLLQRASHPELAIVGIDSGYATAILE